MNRYLTKSRFKLAVECPTKLFYAGKGKEYRDQMAENDFLAMLADGGYQVGKLATQLYPDGVEIEERDHALAEALTREHLQRNEVVLFEPAIRFGDLFIRIDILVKTGNHFELIEVKAKSYDSLNPGIVGARGGITSGMLPYLHDAAFQTWVLRQAFPDAQISTYLMMPDKQKIAPVDGVNQIFKIDKVSTVNVQPRPGHDLRELADQLLAKVPVDHYVAQILDNPLKYPGGATKLEDLAPAWAQAYRENRRIDPVIGPHCGSCQFKTNPGDTLKSGFSECWQQATTMSAAEIEQGTVLDIWNYRNKQQLIDDGKFRLDQISREDFKDFEDEPGEDGLSNTQRQWLQIGGIPQNYKCGDAYFDSVLVAREMAQWRFPLHMIDFETASVALPFYKGMRPYQAVAFQFSHHIIEKDGSVRHAGDFLCVKPGRFPNYDFTHVLKRELEGDDGSVFMWSHHENTILKSILEQLADDPNPPEDTEELAAFIRRLIKGGDRAMVDLRQLAQKAFYHPDTKGSCSIKKVLPAMIKTSGALRDTYSRPVYGAPGGIFSRHFSQPEGFVWLGRSSDGKIGDPYDRLKQLAESLLPGDQLTAEDRTSIIAEGGAAATAYARLQFEDMTDKDRERIESALLRYCELDTLAMVMVVQGWQDLLAKART